MELYEEILIHALQNHPIQVTFPDLKIDGKELVEMTCYDALRKIKAVLEDDQLDDEECFMKIEEIVCVFEALGSDAGSRHDF